MINMTHRTNIHMRLITLELCLTHDAYLLFLMTGLMPAAITRRGPA
jgi:hypothetical protein